eukprot:COSAG02_NODE_3271_length_7032_cov_60.609028_4_plen_352_part_00
MGAGKVKKQLQEKYATTELGAPVNDGRRRPQPRKAAVPAQHGGKGRKTGGYQTDAAREVALAAEREQQMRVAARQQAMAHARAMARARNQSKVIKQTRASFTAADAADAADAAAVAESATEGMKPGAAGEHSSPMHRPDSPTPGAPGSAARGFRHPSNRRSPSVAQAAGTQANPSAPTVDDSGLLPASDSIGGSGSGGTGLTFVDELDLAAARLERMSSAGGETRVLTQEHERNRADARQQPPRGSHNSRDLSAPAAWELCIKNSELTMDEDEDQIGMGGTGTVYKALWCGAPVAVKKIYYGDDHDHDPASLESLKKEADILATLRHPNIVLFLGASFAPPNIFLVSELVS